MSQQSMLSLVCEGVEKKKERSKNHMINLPPGIKRRNPGTKKIALETPVRTATLVTHSKDTVIITDQCKHDTKSTTYWLMCCVALKSNPRMKFFFIHSIRMTLNKIINLTI